VSQLWWRRRAFLESVGDEERFHLTNGPPTPDQRHPVRSARIEGDEIEVELAPVRAMAFGNPVLRVLLDRADGLIARSVALPGWRRAGVRRLARGRGPLHIRLKGRGRSRAADTPPLDCFVKLDWPFERRLGLFDSWGWRGVPLPDLVSQESEPPVHQDQVAALPGAGHFFENVRM
jgi:hypothetical protein